VTNPDIFNFCLYIAGDTSNSARAVANFHLICQMYIPGKYKIEIVDVFKEPDRALEERIFMTPTLLKRGPAPLARIVGNLSNTDLVLQALDLGNLII